MREREKGKGEEERKKDDREYVSSPEGDDPAVFPGTQRRTLASVSQDNYTKSKPTPASWSLLHVICFL